MRFLKGCNIMNEKYIDFVESIANQNNKCIHEIGMKTIDSQNIDLDELNSVDDLIIVLSESKVNSFSTLRMLQNTIKEYARFSNNKMLYNLAEQINIRTIWEEIRHESRPSFLCHKHFMQIYNDLAYKENGLYLQTLFRTVYEGISDFNVLVNLRKADIQDNVVTVRGKNEDIWTIEVTEELATKLVALSGVDEWQRHNIHDYFSIPLTGKFADSVFKIECRTQFSDNNCIYVYRNRLKMIAKEYIGYPVSAQNLSMSGIIYRISEKFGISEFDFPQSLKEDFRIDGKLRNIIENELARSHYESNARYFKNYVLSHDFITELLIK